MSEPDTTVYFVVNPTLNLCDLLDLRVQHTGLISTSTRRQSQEVVAQLELTVIEGEGTCQCVAEKYSSISFSDTDTHTDYRKPSASE